MILLLYRRIIMVVKGCSSQLPRYCCRVGLGNWTPEVDTSASWLDLVSFEPLDKMIADMCTANWKTRISHSTCPF